MMTHGTILLVDNKKGALDSLKVLLEGDYRVHTALNSIEAENILRREHIDVAIVDLRLENERDEKDISGLLLARQIPRAVPKIILTAFPTSDSARLALSRLVSPGGALAVDYLSKKEGPEAILRAVRAALLQKVFIIHGHDEAAKDATVSLVRKLGLQPIVLRDEPAGGRTILETLEDHAKVGFAVALLTSDDFGGSQNTPHDTKPRARQNVIFELGYFIGKLGRRQVCVLSRGGVEFFSDYSGVLYIAMDSDGAWMGKLAREMQHARLNVDLDS